MKDIASSDLKTILHSKRANLYFLEHCRVMVTGGRVAYVTDAGKRSLYWNIPIANTVTLLLGPGTSVTQAAMRELAKAGVLVGFSGGGGTPLFAAVEANADIDVAWLTPQSEYRPTEYLQAWMRWWFDDGARLSAAKQLQHARLDWLAKIWTTARDASIETDLQRLKSLLEASRVRIASAPDITALLTEEARLAKALYALVAQSTGYGDFTRTKRGGGTDSANRFLDHGNYLAYGLAASACWVLGLPHGLAVLHGKTRRGALVFDIADLVKDAVVLPQAFVSAMRGESEAEFRRGCIDSLTRTEALDFMIDTLKLLATQTTVQTSS